MSIENFGARVRAVRRQKGLRQGEIAEAAEMSQPEVSRIERGLVRQPGLRVIGRLSRALGVTVDFLIGGPGGASMTGDGDFIAGEFGKTYTSLNKAAKKQLLHYARFLAQEKENRRRVESK